MKPSAAWILLVIAMSGAAYWFATSGRLAYPPPEVARLELARGNVERTSSCLSVDSVLHANGLVDGGQGPAAVWASRVKDEWTMRLELGDRKWRAYTFQVEGDQLVPVNVVSSDGLPDLGTEQAIDELLARVAASPASGCARNPL